jgi:hypothetical protein
MLHEQGVVGRWLRECGGHELYHADTRELGEASLRKPTNHIERRGMAPTVYLDPRKDYGLQSKEGGEDEEDNDASFAEGKTSWDAGGAGAEGDFDGPRYAEGDRYREGEAE